VADWIVVLFRWLIAVPYCGARFLEALGTVFAGRGSADFPAVRWCWRFSSAPQPSRRLAARGLVCRELPRKFRDEERPHFFSIRWMTFCLGQEWTAARGLLPALVARSDGRVCSRTALRGAAGFIRDNHFLSCSQRLPDCEVPAFGARSHLPEFSMLAHAADLKTSISGQ
jgi:hypothetical protein